MDKLVPQTPTPLSPWPIHDYEEILLACDPGEALQPDDPRYMDLSVLRSDVGIRQLKNTLRQRTASGKYHHCLL